MDKSESKHDDPKKERRLDPELLKKGLRCDLDQYEMLKRCWENRDITKWNKHRKTHPDEEILLEGAKLRGVHLEGANFEWAKLQSADFEGAHLEGEDTRFWSAKARNARFVGTHLEGADLSVAHLYNCNFSGSFLENARIVSSHINGADFAHADLRGCSVLGAIVDGETNLAYCQVNRYSTQQRFTDFNIVALSSVRIDPGTKQLLQYNIRRMNWERWYEDANEPMKGNKWFFRIDRIRLGTNRVLKRLVRCFWEISDYGISTKRIISTFFKCALAFAAVYYICGFIDYHFMCVKDYPGIVSNLFVLEANQEAVSCWLVPFRAGYFSIVTMTTLGLGDMYANAHSFLRGLFGHVLLALQVILGYVLLGALVTRFAVLFTAGGPAGKFADEKKEG